MIKLIIYLVGFIYCYYLLSRYKRKQMGKYYDYSHVLGTFFISLFSWLAVIIHTIIELSENEKFKKIKPPKWL